MKATTLFFAALLATSISFTACADNADEASAVDTTAAPMLDTTMITPPPTEAVIDTAASMIDTTGIVDTTATTAP